MPVLPKPRPAPGSRPGRASWHAQSSQWRWACAAGCSGGQSLGILAGVVVGLAVAAELVQWVADRIWWIGGTLAVCFARAVAASMALEAWADRRGARFTALHGIRSRADVILPEPVRAVVVEPAPARREFEPRAFTCTSMACPRSSRPRSSAGLSPGRGGTRSLEGNDRGFVQGRPGLVGRQPAATTRSRRRRSGYVGQVRRHDTQVVTRLCPCSRHMRNVAPADLIALGRSWTWTADQRPGAS